MKKLLFCVLVGVLCSLSSRAQGITEKNPLYAWKPGEIGNVYEKTLIVYEDFYGNKTKRVVKGVKIGINISMGGYFIVFPNENGVWEKIHVVSSELMTIHGINLYHYDGSFVDKHNKGVGESVHVVTKNTRLDEFINPRDGYSQGEDIDNYKILIANLESIEAGKRKEYTLLPYKNSQKEIELMEEKRKEEERQARLRQEEEERRERMRREEVIRGLLAEENQQKIIEVYKERVAEIVEEEENKLTAQYPVPQKKDLNDTLEVLIHVNSERTDVYGVDGKILDSTLYNLSLEAQPYCTLDGVNYWIYGNHYFYTKTLFAKVHVEKGLLGLEKKNGVFRYYGNFPSSVKEWCDKHIVGSGFQAIQYTYRDGEYIVIPVTVSKYTMKVIQGKNPDKKRRVWRTIGTIAGLGVVGWLISLVV